jgi:hypothetical protein
MGQRQKATDPSDAKIIILITYYAYFAYTHFPLAISGCISTARAHIVLNSLQCGLAAGISHTSAVSLNVGFGWAIPPTRSRVQPELYL